LKVVPGKVLSKNWKYLWSIGALTKPITAISRTVRLTSKDSAFGRESSFRKKKK
jgi:hypothetical protein